MSKDSKAIAILLAAACCAGACASMKTGRQTPAASVQSPTFRMQVEELFQKGKTFMEKGDMEAAKFYFNRTVDTLLDADPQTVSERGEMADDYIERISALELNLIKDRMNGQNGQHEAFLDEVIATPLFPPSQQDMLDMQKKVGTAVAFDIPVVINPQVVSFIKAFQTIRHEGIQRALSRSREFLDTYKATFRKYELPEDLAYLPIIESGFRVTATSRAKARGIWQFMASTARLYGLRVDWVVDERLNPFKAAEAAAKFLKALYQEYGDWYIALACYNGGPRRVERAINRMQTNDFFEINQSRYIRRETRNYVPAFLASLIIAKSPQEYGFVMEKSVAADTADPTFSDSKIVSVPSPVNLQQVADALLVPLSRLKDLNPELLRDFTPTGTPSYDIRIPGVADETPLAKLERIPASKIKEYTTYKVRSGDTLYSIARRFHVSLTRLKSVNGRRSSLIHPGEHLVIPRE